MGTAWWITSSLILSASTARTCLAISAPFVVSVPLVSAPSVLFLPLPRLTLRLTPSLMELITMLPSLALVSRTCVWISSRSAWTLWRRYFAMPRLPREQLMRLFLLEDLPVSLRYRVCFPSSSTERNHASLSTQMRLLLMELPYRLLSFLERTSLRSSLSFFFLMLPHFPSVLRLLEV